MCGIFGIAIQNLSSDTRTQVVRLTELLFKLSESRGKEASGLAVFHYQSKKLAFLRSSEAGSRLMRSSACRELIDSLTAEPSSGTYLFIGHSRLVTNGNQGDAENNQPVVRGSTAVVHNGILVNVDNLWKSHPRLSRQAEVDTEFISSWLSASDNSNKSSQDMFAELMTQIQGTASIATILSDRGEGLFGTNNGSLYQLVGTDIAVWASERLYLEKIKSKFPQLSGIGSSSIKNLTSGRATVVDLKSFKVREFSMSEPSRGASSNEFLENISVRDFTVQKNERIRYSQVSNVVKSKSEEGLLQDNRTAISQLKRCSKCILPETFPFIIFDSQGVCNYCNNYRSSRMLGRDVLESHIETARSNSGSKPDCLVSFSGGRDSSYALHLIKTELKMNPIAYTYDWGMVTDLARRNQARMCGKLGIEHILVSADLVRKRDNIRKNVSAWLKKPSLGTIPLFMAGDKQFFYHANRVSTGNELPLVFLSENPFERTDFKSGFCGIAPSFGKKNHIYSLSTLSKLKMIFFYSRHFATNPGYLNSSLVDSFAAFVSYYFIPHNYINIFNYIPFDESLVDSTLINEYEWEISADTPTTWRIGDGTAAFYNYIYYNVAGFSENETFRSNQIREGVIDRETALKKAFDENKARYESIRWYLDTIDLDFTKTIQTINAIPKMYPV